MNFKKILILFIIIISTSLLVLGCSNKSNNNSISTFNSVVNKVDIKNNRLYVSPLDKEINLNDSIYIDCSDTDLIYAEFATDNFKILTLKDFSIGDEILVYANLNDINKNTKSLKATEIQLMTQKFNSSNKKNMIVKGNIESVNENKISIKYTTEDETSIFFDVLGNVDCSDAYIVCINGEKSFDTDISKLKIGDSVGIDVDIDKNINPKDLVPNRIIVYNDVSDR
ncbi:hypothetical protein [Peptacetobacter sp.]|uniref:hypothetical protein n=1 Tax=Peptacetobacter sp. TaxID=2991975 RepID=UPI002612BB93|nr:hypothetical protein [Peptacetobacter sp.]